MLATSTDGVTKVAIARHSTGTTIVRPGRHGVTTLRRGPSRSSDHYRACRALVVGGIAAACAAAGVALVGGETAEHPGLLGPDDYDVAGAATGVVEYDSILQPALVQPGDVVLGLASSGLHSNGYSLVRRVVSAAGWSLDRDVAELGQTLGDALLTPTRVYAADLLSLLRAEPGAVHALSHITGGGLAANVARVLPPGVHARLDRSTWTRPAIFDLVGSLGRVPEADLERTLNIGVGFAAVVAPDRVDGALALGGRASCLGHG